MSTDQSLTVWLENFGVDGIFFFVRADNVIYVLAVNLIVVGPAYILWLVRTLLMFLFGYQA